MKHSFKKEFRRFLCFLMTFIMILTSMPVHLLAAYDYTDLSNDKSKIINNKTPVKVAKPEAGKTAEDLIKNPKQPDIYTLRTDYKVKRGEKYKVNYQPYIASVGAGASDAEKAKVNKPIPMPAIAGYKKPQENFTIDYDTVKNAADGKNKKGDDNNGFRYSANKEFNYDSISNEIKIKHVFQKLDDFTKYTNPDGSVGDDGALFTTQNGNTGSTMQAGPLTEGHPNRKGFVPEAKYINMQVPENAKDLILEYRYNRAHYDVVYDTQGGTALPTRTLYYEQVIPKIADAPTKVGGVFQGWKPSVDISTKDGKTFKANEIIKVGTGQAIKDLDAKLEMPASNLTFTAVWKDNEKADYAVQFWAEKADHADGASLLDKYDYMGTRVYKDKDTGMRPDLDTEPVNGLKFPDLDQARLNKIWANARFNRGHDLFLNKFYVYNKDLTADQNKDPANVNLVKSVDATGKTVYNIYYDRQVYDLYFTKSNAQPEKNTIYPEIWGYDKAKGEAVMLGGPGKPYHYKARFNEMMYKWPNDAKQTKGFTPGYQSFGWGPNYTRPNWPTHLDTPPYRLNADEFLDMANYTNWGGYTKKIDKGDGTTMDLDPLDFKTLSFGIKQDSPSIPHHMDFWMDGFKKDETIIRYDLVRTKADTSTLTYGHKYPKVTGFTPYGYNPRSAWPTIAEGSEEDGRVNEERINDLNDERDEITPNTCGSYYNNYGTKLPIGQLDFISHFFSDSDEFGDVKEDGQEFTENGYLQFKYTRNKYPLRFNYDPSIIRDDSYFNSKNQLDTFYEFPLKALNPGVDEDDEYKKVGTKEGPKNLLDNPENLQKLGLLDLVFKDSKDGKLKVKRPEDLSDQMVFKGWALDPAGTKLVWENPKETMPFHPLNLYAKWGEPDYQWKVTFDPNGGNLSSIDEAKVTQKRKTIQVGDKGQEESKTFAKKEANEGDKQVFTVIQRQKLVEPPKPTRNGYDFMGWEVIHYKKDANTGDYTNEQDTSYRDTYKVPELYSFGNDVVAPVYLKAIWAPNDSADVKVEHHILSLDLSKETKKITETLHNKRTGYLVATSGDKQNEEYILETHERLEKKLTGDLKTLYEDYNARVKANNTYFQTFKVEPEKIPDPKDSSKMIENPKFKDNVFHFFYRPFRTRDYKVNYIDERGKAEVEKFFKGLNLTDTSGLKDDALLKANEENKEKFEAKRKAFEELIKEYQIVDPEAVSNGNRHYDARNYRQIPGWVLAKDEKPQQQLAFDVNEKTNEFLGINGTGADQVFFYYKDVRVIEVSNKDDPVPDGYVRVTFKAEKGGSFKDKDGKEVTELYYDVIKGLQSQFLPVPQEWVGGKNDDGSEKQKEEGKYYITPETGKKFIKWDKSPLLNDNTIIKGDHTFTAYFEWSGLSASGLVKTEAFKDPNNKWTNDFAPKIEDLKKQLVWMEKGKEKPLPAGAVIKLYDEDGNELTTDKQVYDLVNEKKAADKDELVRTVNVKAKVTFTDGKDPQELDIPIKVYKNVYEALNKEGDKPLFLKEAEGKEAKDGGLKDVTGNYVKVTVQPTEKNTNKDAKVYYVNPKAWVNIPEVEWSQDDKDKTDFLKWTADKKEQNEKKEETGIFDFKKRHKFTDEETLIKPLFTNDVVEQKEGEDKPKVPDNFVKVIVKTTEKATDETKFEKTFWVNPTKEVTIPVTDPTGKTVDKTATEEAKAYTFNDWKSNEETSRTWANGIKGQFTKETTITAEYTDVQNIIPYDPSATDPMSRPDGYVRVTFAVEDGLKLTEQKAYYVKKNSGVTLKKLTKPKYTVETGYEFTNWDKEDTLEIKDDDILVTAKAKVLADFDTKQHPGYVKVTFKAGDNGVIKENGNKINEKVYYVNPNKYVNLPAPTPDGNTGYDFSTWKSDKSQSDFSLANFVNYKKDTTITAMFNQKEAVYPKLKGSTKPAGYVEVTFKVTGTDGKIADNEITTYYVDPTRQVSLKAPKTVAGTGYVFDKWRLGTNPTDQIIKPADQRQYMKDTTIYGSFTKLKDIIPATNDDGTPNLQPIDYVAVLFIGGDHANKLDGQFLYYVNPKAGKTIGDLTKPTVTPDTGWKHTGWDVKDSTDIKDYIFVVAQYDPIADVIPKTKADDSEKPAGYVKVTFKSGANGKIQEKGADITEKVYYVNPAKYVNLTPPTTAPNTSFEFSTWESDGEDFILANNINYTKDTIITAKFNTKGDVIPKTKNDDSENPGGFVKVTFVIDTTKAGKIDANQTTTYFVRPKTDVTIQPPKTKANTGYEFEKWSIDTTEAKKYATDTTVKGEFTKLDEIIPSKNPDGTVNAKPEGYVIVNFLKGDHGVLDGRTTFYVNPKAGKKLKDLDTKGITVVPSPTYKFDKWDKVMDTDITGPDNISVTATYTQLPDIIKAGPKDTAPDGYVVIIFETDGRGTITGNPAYEKTPPAGKENEIVYFVNPKKGIKLAKLDPGVAPTAEQLAIPSTTPNDSTKYIFDQWRAGIDTETPIIRGRVHIAMFKPKVVKLTYNANGATGTVPPELTVDYDANVRLAGKGDLAKKDAKFLGWKIGDKTYQAGDQINLKEDTTAYAQWDDDKKIIKYDPVNNPTTRPDDTYIRVTFAVEDGLKLKEQKAYYVKKDANITLGDAGLVKPKYDVETGYKFDKWDKDDSLEITTDILVTAKAIKLGKVIPEKDTNGNTNAKPEGYKEVVFKVKDEDQSKGSITGVAKFYVNPTEYVTINPPTTKAETGYAFGAWDKDATIPTVYDKDATITGGFNGLKDVIPKTKDDESEKPKGYKTVTFVIDPAKGGKIADGEVTVYYVNPAKEVTVPQPKTQAETGYEFEKWDKDTTTAKKYTDDTTVKGNFKKLEDIIPSTDDKGNPNAKPEGYVTVTFDKGEHGTEIKGQTVYYVNPKANPAKTLGDTTIVKPTVKADVGYKFTGWNFADTKEILSDLTVIAQYEELDDVIPKTKTDESEKPDGYITVTFVKGNHGKELTGQAVYYVNPNKAVVLKDKAPTAVPETGYKFARWDISIDQAIQYKDGAKITALYNEPGNISTTEVEGYVKVEFKAGNNGSLEGTQAYWIKPEVEVNIPAPTVKPNVGYKFKNWGKSLTVTAKKNDPTYEITAGYTQLDNIIPQKNTDGSDRPNGYVTVTFVSDGNGTLSGTKVYYVKQNVEVNLTDKANDIKKTPNIGYTAKGGTWDKTLNAKFKDGDVIKFNFKALPDVIKKTTNDESEKPERYVKVEFTSDANGSLEGGDKTYYVNPYKKVKVGSTNLPIPTPKPNDNYTFVKWLENINKKEEIITDKKYVATFKINKVTMTYKADDKTSGTVPKELSYDIDTEITLAGGKDLKKDNFVLEGWKIGEKTYKPGETFTINENTTAVAVWSADTHTVEFDTDGGTRIPVQKVKHDELIKPVKNPEKPNYTFIGWKVDGKDFNPAKEKITKDITLVAQYVPDVIPQKGTEKPKDVPKNFVEVKFVPTDKATDSTPQIFWVNPNKEVTIPVSNPTGKQHFTFKEWKIGDVTKGETYKVGTAKKFETATTITATYTEAENIIPYDPQKPITAPDGYVRVTFEADEGLTLSNVKYYYVKKNSGVTLEKLTKPNVNSKVGFEFKNWDKENTLKINDKDVVVKAKSTPIADVIEGKLGVEKPDGYITVTFKTTDKAGNVEKVVYINPNKAVELTSYAPEVKPITGYEFADWDRPINEKIQYNDKDVITAKFNEQGAVIPKTNPDGTENTKPDGYKTVTFVIEGQGGKIADGAVTVYYVNPDKDVIVSQPKTQAEIGYEFDKWDIDTTTTAKKYTEDTTVTGNFKKLDDIIPSTDKNGKPNAQPEGYVTVTFDKGTNGNLTGQTAYYVNPKAGKTLGDKLIVKPTVKAETGYKFTGWDTKDSLVIKADKTVTAKYEAKSPDQPGGTTPGETPGGTTPGENPDQPGGTTPGENPDKPNPDKPNPDKPNPGENPDQPGDKPGDNPGTPGNPETPGTVPENPGAIPGTKPGVVEKHGNRYVERVAGKNRVHTAINTSNRFFKKSKYVIIADSGNYPDALTATVLAHVLDAPILLNNTRYLEDDVAREIVRLGASEVIIVGGHKSISENVKSQLAKYDANKVQRIWGRDRYVTSSELAYEIERLTGKVNKAIIASGENFPDALATAPLGSKEIAPILLVTRNQMNKKVSKALKDLNINKVYVAGGQNSVSKKLEAQLPQVIRRFSGQDRYETAILVASYTYPESKEVFVASGETFPDALVIGPVCARRKAPILLSKSTPVKSTDDYIEKSKIEYLYIIGGVNTIHVDTVHKYAIED
ncbi:MAG: cell wall-binding repeat-containing protein [Finegoldia magna]|uniref:cell wall-binding repeat-containing protein n=1 Tax=Finegoldia magna TaxID=1260 RepID=UPI002913F150|nr:cell wall-binding repeat-containing protein [Finegoldia magna]MDU5272393.1 cell wall-binding repeat-containing protein [Finegoldia magna]